MAIERRGLLDALEKDVRDLVDELRREWRLEIEREIGTLKNENAELRGMLGSLLAVISTRAAIVDQRGGHAPQSGEVVELPRGFLRRDHAA